DIRKFEQFTNIHLTENDLRIISMNRFSSLEQSINRQLTESEYRYLLQNHLSFDYIEQKLLQRPLTIEERIEQEELTLQPYQEYFTDKTSILSRKFIDNLEQQNIKLTHIQLEQILQYRAQLVDQYDIIHSISPSIKLIEEQINRSLTIDEKKHLIHDDYSIIEQIKNQKYNNINRKIQEILPITASLLKVVENTQDKNLLENIKHLENTIGRSLTKQEIIMVANGDIIGLEKIFNKSLLKETIKSIYNDRFIDLKNELNRNLTDKEIRDILLRKFSGIEKTLGRQLAPSKPSNSIIATFRHLQAFSNDYSGTILTEDECKQFQTIAMEEITKNYYELCSEILSSVRKMEDSIQRLRRVRESSKALSSMTQSMTTSSTASLTDDNKIRMQIQHDVTTYTAELKNLGIQIESSNKLTILSEESRLQI
ncbi:unnamed protein product, partial [Rotaria sp. Silwood2]